MAYEYRCETCNAPSTASRKDARYCKACMALKILEYVRGKFKRARKCRTCGERFRPMKAQDLSYCGDCETRQLVANQAQPFRDTRCAYCRGEVPKRSLLPTVCLRCLKDPAKQDKIVALLAKQQTERIVEHRATMEE